jgi:HEAT repeat protein
MPVLRSFSIASFACLCAALPARSQGQDKDNPYSLEPFHADFPVELQWPVRRGLQYEGTRRQILERLAANLQGNVSRDAWLFAVEFYWRAPDDAVEPLVAAMDRAFGNPALHDYCRSCVEAMGKMANPRLETALRRAAEHPNENVRQAAFLALTRSGTDDALRGMRGWFERLDARARAAWLLAMRQRLPAETTEPFRELMMADYPTDVRDQILEQALLLPVPQAAEIVRGRWEQALGEFKAIIAGVLHAAGDTAGTAWIRDTLHSEDLTAVQLAIRHSTFGELGDLRSEVLGMSVHPRPEVRFEVAKALVAVQGDDVADVYETLATPNEAWDTKVLALRQLTLRGRGNVVASMLGDLETATGTRLQGLVTQVALSGDPRAAADLLARYRRADGPEGRQFLQALSQNGTPAAADALFEVFLGPEELVQRTSTGSLTTLNYVPTLMPNLRHADDHLVGLLDTIAPDDWQRRAVSMPVYAGLATDRKDEALQQRCVATLRGVLFDREQLPQLRVLALNLLKMHWLTIDDVLKLKNMRRSEEPGMSALLTDFLGEYF